MQKSQHSLYLIIVYLLFGHGSTLVHAGTALQNDEANLYDDRRIALGIGIGIARFDTNVKVTDKQGGGSHYLDLEGNLDLPETSQLTTIYGGFKFNDRHT